MKKRFAFIILFISMCLGSIVGCGGSAARPSEAAKPTETPVPTNTSTPTPTETPAPTPDVVRDETQGITYTYGRFLAGQDYVEGYEADITYASGDLVIADDINGYPVVSITSDSAFQDVLVVVGYAVTGEPYVDYVSTDIINDSITSIKLFDNIKCIGDYAFHGCANLTEIVIPEGVTSIGAYAFENCNSLTNVNIPAGVTAIGKDAFAGCTSLTSITIPKSVTCIEDGAFDGCSFTVCYVKEGSYAEQYMKDNFPSAEIKYY